MKNRISRPGRTRRVRSAAAGAGGARRGAGLGKGRLLALAPERAGRRTRLTGRSRSGIIGLSSSYRAPCEARVSTACGFVYDVPPVSMSGAGFRWGTS